MRTTLKTKDKWINRFWFGRDCRGRTGPVMAAELDSNGGISHTHAVKYK